MTWSEESLNSCHRLCESSNQSRPLPIPSSGAELVLVGGEARDGYVAFWGPGSLTDGLASQTPNTDVSPQSEAPLAQP